MSRILTGIQSSGRPHLGNVLGAIAPAIELSNKFEEPSLLFIADFHSLTTIKDSAERKRNVNEVAAAYIACGYDYSNNLLYKQSSIPEVCELTWYLNCFTPYPMLASAHSFKDKSDRLSDVNAGLFTYPVLMACDILMYDANMVPVGKDQQQHLEITRDLALSINNRFGQEVFVVPEAMIRESVKVVPGTDGQKMSKSYKNTIDLFAPESELKKQVMSIVTDSTPLEEPKNPDTCHVFALYKLVASESLTLEMRENYLKGGYGYGHAKKELLRVLLETYAAPRDKFNYLISKPQELEVILEAGAAKARKIAIPVLERVRDLLGY